MMTSQKEEWRQKISDSDSLFIKRGWLVDKSNRPLPFVNQENRRFPHSAPPIPITMKAENTPWQIGLNVVTPKTLDITQFLVQFNSRWILQLINGISEDLQKLLKYLSRTATFTALVLPSPPVTVISPFTWIYASE